MAPETRTNIAVVSHLLQTLLIAIGVIFVMVSLSRSAAQERDTGGAVVAARPFLELRQRQYEQIVDAATVLALPKLHSPAELEDARKRFRAAFVGRAVMVESQEVRSALVTFNDSLARGDGLEEAAGNLAQAVRGSLLHSWGLEEQSTSARP